MTASAKFIRTRIKVFIGQTFHVHCMRYNRLDNTYTRNIL